MIQMVALEMPEEAIARLSEMQEIVCPLLPDIALNDTRKQGGQGVYGKQETQRCGYEKERQDILQLAADVPTIKRPLMVFPMKRVEPLVKKATNQALARGKAAVEDVAMKEIFHQGPNRNTRQVENQPDPWMTAAQTKKRHDQRVRRVENRQWIEPPPRNTGLFAFVGGERALYRTIAG